MIIYLFLPHFLYITKSNLPFPPLVLHLSNPFMFFYYFFFSPKIFLFIFYLFISLSILVRLIKLPIWAPSFHQKKFPIFINKIFPKNFPIFTNKSPTCFVAPPYSWKITSHHLDQPIPTHKILLATSLSILVRVNDSYHAPNPLGV